MLLILVVKYARQFLLFMGKIRIEKLQRTHSLSKKEFDRSKRRLIHMLRTNTLLLRLAISKLHNYVGVTTQVQNRGWNWTKSFGGSTSSDSEFGAADSCKVNYNFLSSLQKVAVHSQLITSDIFFSSLHPILSFIQWI